MTNALSTRMEVTVWRDSSEYQLVFANGGIVEAPLARLGDAVPRKKTGTRVRIWPDPKYFDTAQIPMNELLRLLRSKAVLMPGVTVVLNNEKTANRKNGFMNAGLPAI